MIKSLVVLGSGTSGLLAALMMKKAFNDMSVKVVASERIGIIGVGEGATEHWKFLCNFLGINMNEAVVHCGATMKVGIVFKDWGVPDYYHSVFDSYAWKNGETYPFYSKLMGDRVDSIQLTGRGSREPIVPLGWATMKEDPEASQFHFNTFKLNEYLHRLCKERGIEIINDEITDVVIEDGVVKELIGSQKHSADFFIDSSGMARVIIGKLGAQWNSYGKHLITNSAIAFPTEDTDEYPIYTTATAMKHGWMWNTPVQGRWGNGYVFCDKYIDFDQAQAEVEEKLGKKVNIFKKIKFDPGTLDKNWISNCCAIGLSSGFVEPLESSAISQGLLQTWLLMNVFPSWGNSKKSITDLYNSKCRAISENILDFIAVHFITPREDTEFWKYLKLNRSKWVPKSLEKNLKSWHKRTPLSFEFDSQWTLFKAENWILTLYGLGLFDLDAIKEEYELHDQSVKDYVNGYLQDEIDFINSRTYVSHKKGLEMFVENFNKIKTEYKL
jgi:tryptophan halogenase